MAGGGKGGSQTTSVQVPAWLEQAAQKNLGRADAVSGIGYTPYYGPDVAALTPMQVGAMSNANAGANAFGMGSADPFAGMPAPQTFAGGVQGYSSAPMYEESLAKLKAQSPGQYQAIMDMFINPQTGAASPVTQAVNTALTQAPAREGGNGGETAGYGPPGGTGGGFSLGGYTGVRDMVNGGGPGAAGTSFSGGPMSGIANGIGVSPMGGGSSGMGGGKR